MTKIALRVDVNVDDLVDSLNAELSNEALLKLIKVLDKRVADWGFTKKLYTYFRAEMKQLAEEEGKPVGRDFPEPWLDAEIERLWHNSPAVQRDAKSLAAFSRIVKLVESAQGIRPE